MEEIFCIIIIIRISKVDISRKLVDAFSFLKINAWIFCCATGKQKSSEMAIFPGVIYRMEAL